MNKEIKKMTAVIVIILIVALTILQIVKTVVDSKDNVEIELRIEKDSGGSFKMKKLQHMILPCCP